MHWLDTSIQNNLREHDKANGTNSNFIQRIDLVRKVYYKGDVDEKTKYSKLLYTMKQTANQNCDEFFIQFEDYAKRAEVDVKDLVHCCFNAISIEEVSKDVARIIPTKECKDFN